MIIKKIIAATAILFMSIVFAGCEKNLSNGAKVDSEILASDTNHVVLVNFWAAYDAKSREENVRFSRALKGIQKPDFTSISVSLDQYESLFKAITNIDKLAFTKVIRVNGFNSEIAKEFKMDNKFGNYLIKNGKVLAKNVTPEQLQEMLKEIK